MNPYQILVINPLQNNGNLLRQLFQFRYKGFILEQKYNVFHCNGLEFDQYDTPLTEYIIVLKEGNIIACIRLNRMNILHNKGTRQEISYMARDLWKNQIDAQYLEPNNDAIELTRLYVDSNLPLHERGIISRLVISCTYFYSTHLGINEWYFVTSKKELNIASRLGIGVKYLCDIKVENFADLQYCKAAITKHNIQVNIPKQIMENTRQFIESLK